MSTATTANSTEDNNSRRLIRALLLRMADAVYAEKRCYRIGVPTQANIKTFETQSRMPATSCQTKSWAQVTRVIMLLLAWRCGVGDALGHGDVHLQIQQVTEQIRKQPHSGELYLRRAELHRVHREWDAAIADYDRALTLDTNLHLADLGRGRTYLEAAWPLSAKVVLDRFLQRYTNHVEALVTRARVNVKLADSPAANRDFTAAIHSSSQPAPEFYIERAAALSAAGPQQFDNALRGLDEGIKKLGPLVTLQLYAIDLELKQRRFDSALVRLEKIAAQSPRKETWLARRGEILRDANRAAEARKAFEAAVKAIELLPSSRRQTPATAELEKRLRRILSE